MKICFKTLFHRTAALFLILCLLLSAVSGCGQAENGSAGTAGYGETADNSGGQGGTADGNGALDGAGGSYGTVGDSGAANSGSGNGSVDGSGAANPGSGSVNGTTGGGSASADPGSTLSPSSTAALTQAKFNAICREFLREQLVSSYINLHYSLTDPEAYGISHYKISFGDLSLKDLQNTQKQQVGLKLALDNISPGDLSEDQQLTYRILTEALDVEALGYGLELYYQPLAPSNGTQAQLPVLMAEFAFRQKQDIDNYLTLLSSIDAYYRQIVEFQQEKAAKGLFMTDDCADQIIEECEGYLLPAENNFMTTTFDRRIDAFESLTDEERADYKARNLALVEEHFIPAYQLLIDGLTELKGSCTNTEGLCYYPEGRAYYEYLVKASTGTSYETIEDLREAIAEQIEEDLIAMSHVLDEHPETDDAISDFTFAYTDPAEIMDHLSAQITEDFPAAPACNYELRYVPDELSSTLAPAFFLVPPIDDYKNCIIYVNPGSTSDSQDLYSTLAHEGIPGHMYQNTYFLAHCRDDLRKILSFTAYSEGWAFYVENYSYTTDNGLSPELGELLAHNTAAGLGLQALLDMNIHYFGWGRDQVRDFLASYYDVSEDDVVNSVYNTLLSTPVNYLNYYVGYLEILNMREKAEATLGSRFVLKDFHQFLLDTGPAPFKILNEELQKWLEEQ